MTDFRWGARSRACLDTVDERLASICNQALELSPFDLAVTCGHRGEAEQNRLADEGKSRVRYPHGRHNASPSLAVDIHPYPIDYKDTARYCYLAGMMRAAADDHGIDLRWGGNWDRDAVLLTDQRFDDLCHFELVL